MTFHELSTAVAYDITLVPPPLSSDSLSWLVCGSDILTLRKSVGTIEGQVFTDDGAVTQELLGKHGSYMPQEVLLLPMQTVEEALTFQANIRLGR